MTVEYLLAFVNENTFIRIMDADTGELFAEGEASDIAEVIANDGNLIYDDIYEDMMKCLVFDINVWNNKMYICIDGAELE